MKKIQSFLSKELQNLEAAGLIQNGPTVSPAPGGQTKIGTRTLVNFASEDYLGWSQDPRLKEAAVEAQREAGVGTGSGRLASGTQGLHLKLETATARFLRVEDSLAFPTGYVANCGMFESLFSEQDYVFCDFGAHPALVDGIRLSTAKCLVFKNHDLADLEDKLKRSPSARFRAVVVDSVNAQDGKLAPLTEILALADRYDAIVVVDDSRGLGTLGKSGKGVSEHLGLLGQIDLITGTFGQALGGMGGFVAGRKEIISWLRQKNRAYLFSEALPPSLAGAALRAIDLLEKDAPELGRLRENTDHFRGSLEEKGFQVVESAHPIVSIVVRDALVAQTMADRLYQKGSYVMGFCYPVVPRGSARIRVQISAQHSKKDLDAALEAFDEVGRKLRLI